MRAQVRATALRMMQNFPGVEPKEFGELVLTDHESDVLCQTLFSAPYDKIDTALPQIMTMVLRARAITFEEREHGDLATATHAGADFTAKLRSEEIEPIVTPINIGVEWPVDHASDLAHFLRPPLPVVGHRSATTMLRCLPGRWRGRSKPRIGHCGVRCPGDRR